MMKGLLFRTERERRKLGEALRITEPELDEALEEMQLLEYDKAQADRRHDRLLLQEQAVDREIEALHDEYDPSGRVYDEMLELADSLKAGGV